jgi:hypothetical protein
MITPAECHNRIRCSECIGKPTNTKLEMFFQIKIEPTIYMFNSYKNKYFILGNNIR